MFCDTSPAWLNVHSGEHKEGWERRGEEVGRGEDGRGREKREGKGGGEPLSSSSATLSSEVHFLEIEQAELRMRAQERRWCVRHESSSASI